MTAAYEIRERAIARKLFAEGLDTVAIAKRTQRHEADVVRTLDEARGGVAREPAPPLYAMRSWRRAK